MAMQGMQCWPPMQTALETTPYRGFPTMRRLTEFWRSWRVEGAALRSSLRKKLMAVHGKHLNCTQNPSPSSPLIMGASDVDSVGNDAVQGFSDHGEIGEVLEELEGGRSAVKAVLRKKLMAVHGKHLNPCTQNPSPSSPLVMRMYIKLNGAGMGMYHTRPPGPPRPAPSNFLNGTGMGIASNKRGGVGRGPTRPVAIPAFM